ncbi:MAG: hypothetical protein AW06_004304 [Candidatus Accumulibacter cognatus]|uniref:Uncharacterized protein n=1 Tax=Candidatus Accumulibacter cognatus TaxID=2954383 RepID=A0A080M0N4_9PROT|nr:MAG: hypothetical protein AW06_004304 [Candidatus Accumulibacter cognatus]
MRGDAVALAEQLATQGVEHGGRVSVRFERNEGGARDLPRAHAPARELAGQRGLAFATLAANDGVAFAGEQAFEREEFAAATDEAVRRRLRQLAEALPEARTPVFARLRAGHFPEERRVVAVLVEDGDEPVLQAEFADAEDAAAHRVVLQFALAGEHRGTDALALAQGAVEGFDEAPRRFDEDAVAHGDHPADAGLEQGAGDRFVGAFGLRALARFEEDERNAVFAQERAEFGRGDVGVPAPAARAYVFRVFEAERAEAGVPVVDAVAVEVQDVVRLAGALGAIEFVAQGGQRRRGQEMHFDLAGERFHRVDQRPGAGAEVDVGTRVVFRPRAGEQNANRGGEDGDRHRLFARQPAAHAHRLSTLEEVAAAVVQEFPRQAEQERCGFAGQQHLLFGCAGVAGAVDFDRETAREAPLAGTAQAARAARATERGPGLEHFGGRQHWQGGAVE